MEDKTHESYKPRSDSPEIVQEAGEAVSLGAVKVVGPAVEVALANLYQGMAQAQLAATNALVLAQQNAVATQQRVEGILAHQMNLAMTISTNELMNVDIEQAQALNKIGTGHDLASQLAMLAASKSAQSTGIAETLAQLVAVLRAQQKPAT